MIAFSGHCAAHLPHPKILCAACPLICLFHHQEHRCGPFTLNPDALLFQNVSYDAAKQFVRFIKRRLHILLIGKIKVRHPVIHGLQQEVRVLLSAGFFAENLRKLRGDIPIMEAVDVYGIDIVAAIQPNFRLLEEIDHN